MPPTPEEWLAADMDAEATGHAIRRTPEEGIKAMNDRIALLRQRMESVRNNNRDEEVRLIREINAANQRLAEYQAQHDGRN